MSPWIRIAAGTILTVLLFTPVRAAEIIAHRGASADAPENTLAAMKLGYEQGADAGELDIHLSSDGKIVVIHDADTKRVAGVEKKVAEQTFDELRRLGVAGWGDWKGKGFAEKVPTLDEMLALVPKGKKILIEIKCKSEALVPLQRSLASSKLSPDQTVIITFHHDVAAAAKKKFPDRQVYWLHDYKQDKDTGRFPELDDLVRKAKQAGVDGLNLNFRFPLDKPAVDRIKAAGLKVYAWTVDDPARARELVDAGVDGVTTNRPGALRRELVRATAPTR